jgi:hypothetical protein
MQLLKSYKLDFMQIAYDTDVKYKSDAKFWAFSLTENLKWDVTVKKIEIENKYKLLHNTNP